MTPTSPIPAILAIILALFTCFLLMKKFGPPDEPGRFLAIDGLRGHLAFGVFIHHSIIWFFYLKTGQWVSPPSNLYAHFGQTSVAFFFMITGFLFFSKILDGKTKKIDWLRLYVSRFLRLMPLYCIAMSALFLIVLILSGANVNEQVSTLLRKIIQWMSFTILGNPDINGVERTSIIMSGVTWSLPYEWFFYLILPAFALLNRVRVGWGYLVISAVAVILIFIKGTVPYHWLSFAGGMSAAYFVRFEYMCKIFRKRIFSVVVILLISTTVIFYPSTHGLMQISMLSAAFIVIAGGNGVFGLLTNNISRILGEMAYGIYLLHGILLFILFKFVIGFEQSKNLTPTLHWAAIIGMTPIVIGVAFFCYKTVERPALSKTNGLTFWLRNKINFRYGALKENI
jgi:peptidoglycan/LPS O-acetylase OafA/YrhL